MRRSSLVLSLAAILVVASCSDDSDKVPKPDDTSTTTTQAPAGAGIANPASEFCEQNGGTLEIVDEAGGQVGYCNLPDGTRIEEWEYFRSQGEP